MNKDRKPRALLVHWKAEERPPRVERLRRAGYAVEVYAGEGGEGLRELRKAPPDLVVIDLDRMPSHGRAVATFLRQQKGTRHVPILFVEGAPEKVALARKQLPDATYTSWTRFAADAKKALRQQPAQPVVPGTMDSYSGTPLPRKLGIRAGSTVALLGAPRGFRQVLGELPERVAIRTRGGTESDVVVQFVKSLADLRRRFPVAARDLAAGGALWIAWPKQTSTLASDVTQNEVRAFGLATGFVDYKICAIDGVWSGLCFARRGMRRKVGAMGTRTGSNARPKARGRR